MDFISQNLLWILAAVISGAFLFVPRLNGGVNRANTIRPQDAVMLINKEKASVIDVRAQSQFDAGHIVNSRHVPLESLSGSEEAISGLPKNKTAPLILVCDAGNLAFKAEKPLKKIGYEKVLLLSGGLKNWVKADLPLVSGSSDNKQKKSIK